MHDAQFGQAATQHSFSPRYAMLPDLKARLVHLLNPLALPDVTVLAETLATRFASVADTLWAHPDILTAMDVPRAVIDYLQLVKDTAVYMDEEQLPKFRLIESTPQLVRYLRKALGSCPEPQCWALFLNRLGRLMGRELMHRGSVDHIFLHPREIIKTALSYNARQIILAVTYPNTYEDFRVELYETFEILAKGCRLLDLRMNHIFLISRDRCGHLRRIGDFWHRDPEEVRWDGLPYSV